MTETWLSAQVDEAKTVELSGFDVKSFELQSRTHGGGIATTYKSTLGSNITFKTDFDFTQTSLEVVLASSIYLLTMFTEQLHDLHDYVNNLLGHVCLVGDMNIYFSNTLHTIDKQNLTTISLNNLVQVINMPIYRCGHTINWVVIRPDDNVHKNLLIQTHLNQTIIALSRTSTFLPSTTYRIARNMANIYRQSFTAELSSVSEFSSAEKANQFCVSCALY